jgi:hypothetical protein
MTALKAAKKRTQADVMAFAEATPCWHQLIESDPKIARFIETYLMMALRAAYRPAAPSDGHGNIQLNRQALDDRHRLAKEAYKYAVAFDKEEDSCSFWIGCSDFTTNRAFILAIEAARVLAGGLDSEPYALALLGLAVEEVKEAIKSNRERLTAAE